VFTRKLFPAVLLTGLMLVACSSNAPDPAPGTLKVVASTTIVGDVVAEVGGDMIALTVLLPPGADPHTFEPRPQDIAAISDADLVVISGLGLEEALEPALEANAKGITIHASEGIQVLEFGEDLQAGDQEGEAHDQEEMDKGNHRHEIDPHTWTDPNNVMVWAGNIATALSKADPTNAESYQANADAYRASLQELDSWIRTEIEQIPAERRKMVSDHLAFGYFTDEYGLEQIGALVGAFSTNAAPSAQELALLEDRIRAENVPAVFVSKTVNPDLAEQVARDTGVKVVFVYTGSLSQPGGEADSYLKFMRYNVQAIVEALK
jgi:ABC-type Zn uptake system ZnuABC Zn-binding protein ZnuA